MTPLQVLCALALHGQVYWASIDVSGLPAQVVIVSQDEIKTLVRDGLATLRRAGREGEVVVTAWDVTDKGEAEAARVCQAVPLKRF